KTILMLTASLSGFAAVSYAVCNSAFVWVWTSFSKRGALTWPAHNDLFLGIWIVTLAILHCHNVFVIYTKRIGFMRYVYFLEGIVFVTAALFLSKVFGLVGLIVASIVCSICFSGAYGVWRVSRYFQVASTTVAFTW